jgi:hypothetical protein
MNIVDALRIRQKELIDHANALVEDEFQYIVSQYDSIISDPIQVQKMVNECPFEPKVKISIKNKNILDDDIATTYIHEKLVDKYKVYITDGHDWIISIVSHVLAQKCPRKINMITVSIPEKQVSQPVDTLETERLDSQLKKVLKERNELKSKLSELSFDTEIMRQEFDAKLKAQKEEHEKIVENIFSELKNHHHKMIESQSFLIDTHERQIKDIEEAYSEEKKMDTLKIEKLTGLLEMIKNNQPKVPPPPPVGRTPKPLSRQPSLKPGNIAKP